TRSKRDWSSDVCSSDLTCSIPLTAVSSARNRRASANCGRRRNYIRTAQQSADGLLVECAPHSLYWRRNNVRASQQPADCLLVHRASSGLHGRWNDLILEVSYFGTAD